MNAKKLFLQIKNRNHWMLHGFARNLNSEHCVSGWNNIKKSQILTKISNKTSFREFKGRQTIFCFLILKKKKENFKSFLAWYHVYFSFFTCKIVCTTLIFNENVYSWNWLFKILFQYFKKNAISALAIASGSSVRRTARSSFYKN